MRIVSVQPQPSYRQNSTFSRPTLQQGSHDLSPAPDMICGLGLEADGASLLLCCFRRRVQRVQQFSGSRKGSSRGAVLLVTSWLDCITEGKGKSPRMEGRGATETWEFSWMNFKRKREFAENAEADFIPASFWSWCTFSRALLWHTWAKLNVSK